MTMKNFKVNKILGVTFYRSGGKNKKFYKKGASTIIHFSEFSNIEKECEKFTLFTKNSCKNNKLNYSTKTLPALLVYFLQKSTE